MTRERFELLLDELLERELTATEAEELAAAVRGEAGLRGELRRHLVLWELWAQEQTPERSAKAFLAACRTRLRAEREGESFVAGLNRRIREETDSAIAERSDAVDCGVGSPDSAEASQAAGAREPALQRSSDRTEITAAHGLFRWWRALQQPTGVLWTAVSAIALAAAVWMLSPRSAQATTTLRGDVVCTACMLHETHEHLPALLVQEAGSTRTYYVQSERDAFLRVGDYCRAPVPLIATGRTEMKDGRLLFSAESVQSASTHDPQNPILFPF